MAIGFWDHGTDVFDEVDDHEVILGRTFRTPLRTARGRSTPERRLFRPFAHLEGKERARAMMHDDTNGGMLTTREAGGVLKAAFKDAGVDGRVDIIFSDTCLNGMAEVLEEFRPYARVIVASEELEPGYGWDYYQWFRAMTAEPPQSAEEWVTQAVESFEVGYRDRPDQHPCTLAAFRPADAICSAFKALVEALDALGHQGYITVLDARSRTQSFAQGYLLDTFDLFDFASKLKTSAATEPLKKACDGMIGALQSARVANVKSGPACQ